MPRQLVRLLVVLLAAVLGLPLVAGVHATAATGLEGYRPGNLVTDAVFYNAAAMDEAAVRSFIAARGSACVDNPDGTPCLRSYVASVPSLAATPFCAAVAGGTLDAATIINRVSKACGINPQMLLILLQRESGLVLTTRPTADQYARATGAGCPDYAPCDPALAGFHLQVYGAAERFRTYRANPTAYRYRANGTSQRVQYHPDPACGTASFVIENQATAGLYIYTPYTPNAASLDAVTGTGDACSSYGNRNFYLYLKTWFPESQPRTGAPVHPSPPSPTSPTPPPVPTPAPSGVVTYAAHVENIGWTPLVADGAVAGTTGRGLRVEAVRLTTPGVTTSGRIEWRGHVQNIGWMPWTTSATDIGTTGRGLRLEAFEMRLTGDLATRYRLRYRAHVQDIGWQPDRTDGQTAGTVGQGLRVEAVQIQLVENARATYAAHVQDIGWMPLVADGAVAGTTGRGLAVEALRLRLAGAPAGAIEWRAHVQDIGWMPWTTSATDIGTTGRGLRLEALEMRLTGDLATRYRLSYRAHVQDIGWQPDRTDGQTAGTVGQGLRVEAVQIQLQPLS